MNNTPATRDLGFATRGATAPTAAPETASGVSVEIACAGRLADIRADWTDLLRRAAEPNVFMDPALIAIAHDSEPEGGHRALLAWKTRAVASSSQASGPSRSAAPGDRFCRCR